MSTEQSRQGACYNGRGEEDEQLEDRVRDRKEAERFVRERYGPPDPGL